MDPGERLDLRELILGEDPQLRRRLLQFLSEPHSDGTTARLVADLGPLFARIEAAVDEHLPFATPREAVDYSVARSAGFTVSFVAEYCGVKEEHGGPAIDEVRRLLAEEVTAGRLTVAYVFDCPTCGNVIDERDHLPDAPFKAQCEGQCPEHGVPEQVVDPATAYAMFVNTRDDPALESWM